MKEPRGNTPDFDKTQRAKAHVLPLNVITKPGDPVKKLQLKLQRKMADISSLSIHVKASLVLILLGGLLDVIGFGSPYWFSGPGVYQGLWKTCISDHCFDLLTYRQYLPGRSQNFSKRQIYSSTILTSV